jgi:hypothetical protein
LWKSVSLYSTLNFLRYCLSSQLLLKYLGPSISIAIWVMLGRSNITRLHLLIMIYYRIHLRFFCIKWFFKVSTWNSKLSLRHIMTSLSIFNCGNIFTCNLHLLYLLILLLIVLLLWYVFSRIVEIRVISNSLVFIWLLTKWIVFSIKLSNRMRPWMSFLCQILNFFICNLENVIFILCVLSWIVDRMY